MSSVSNIDYSPPIFRLTRRAFIYLALAILASIILAPFLIVTVLALSGPEAVFAWPPVIIPETIRWSNFVEVFQVTNFGRAMWNTFVIASISTIGIVLIDGLAGYAFAMMRFPGRPHHPALHHVSQFSPGWWQRHLGFRWSPKASRRRKLAGASRMSQICWN